MARYKNPRDAKEVAKIATKIAKGKDNEPHVQIAQFALDVVYAKGESLSLNDIDALSKQVASQIKEYNRIHVWKPKKANYEEGLMRWNPEKENYEEA